MLRKIWRLHSALGSNLISLNLVLTCLILIVLSCTSPDTGKVTTPQPSKEVSLATPNAMSERRLSFPVQGGKKIDAIVTESSSSEKKLVMFDPFIEPTDGNLYMASLMILGEIYGKERGSIQLNDATTKDVSGLGKAACWTIANPSQSFCVSHMRVSDTDKRLSGMMVWVE